MSRFEEAQAQIDGDSWLDKLARASLTAADTKFGSRRKPAFLAVDVNRDIDADVLSAVARHMQNAVARMGKHLHDPLSQANIVQESDKDRARLYPRRQIGRRIEFGVENLDIANPQLFVSHTETPAERAAIELVNILPESADPEAVAPLAAHDRALLNVVKDVVEAVQAAAAVDLTVSTSSGALTGGVMTRDQAATINTDLLDGKYERDVIPVEGRLDGMRTRRRIFYLEAQGRDYEGVYDPELSDAVIRHVDKPVQAQIERVRLVRNTGKPGRWAYRLLALTDRPTEPGLFE
ncbi:hypothetical protein [Mycobacteroides abscessus]|uniref:hypothetical protein n=1 Tax=Mycobacteroides abscessus TaxID=36809 RepID=UPI0005E27373|nr:hypothetical protein [Mycobacteroides abscessus]CPU82277.1 Uncharacterised protein [Mycobacteroides abscessus]